MENRQDFVKKLIEVAYENHGENFRLAIIPEQMSKQVISYGSMRDDLKSVLKYFEQLKLTTDITIESALSYAAISLYGLCFTASKDFSQLNVDIVFGEETFHKENHYYLKDLRDQFIAHRRKTNNELGAAFIAISKSNPNKATMKYQQMKLGSWSNDRIEGLSSTVNFVLNHIEEKFEKCGIRLYDNMLKKYSPEQLENLIINRLFE